MNKVELCEELRNEITITGLQLTSIAAGDKDFGVKLTSIRDAINAFYVDPHILRSIGSYKNDDNYTGFWTPTELESMKDKLIKDRVPYFLKDKFFR